MCEMLNSGVQLLSRGPCSSANFRSCHQLYKPACGKDAVTYQNECSMKLHGMEKAYDGPCGQEPFRQ